MQHAVDVDVDVDVDIAAFVSQIAHGAVLTRVKAAPCRVDIVVVYVAARLPEKVEDGARNSEAGYSTAETPLT